MYSAYLAGFLILVVYICFERIVSKLCGFYLHSKHQSLVEDAQTVELACQETGK